MFVKAIEETIKFTRPLLTGRMIYQTKEILNDINTLIVLNNQGDILTCAHISDLFQMADDINNVFMPILEELKDKSTKEIKKIETKYAIKENDIALIHNILVDIVDNPGRLNIIKHPVLDIAIIRLENNKNIFVKDFPVFRTSNPLIGEHLCKLGFTFPEYSTFYYDDQENKIKMHNEFMHFPLFPLDGILTRNIVDQNNEVTMFEISTPCLPGQAGGPIFDQDGYICGLMIGTKRITSYYQQDMPFNFDLGIAINNETIMSFLDQNKIEYNKKDK